MNTEEMNIRSVDVIVSEIRMLCGKFQKCVTEVERREEQLIVKYQLEEVCKEGRRYSDILRPALLITLLDAYEITRDEAMLQEVLDVVSGNRERLEVSVDAVKLLAYCWYYVEEEECVVRAREMLEELKRRGKDVAEAEKVLEELTENF